MNEKERRNDNVGDEVAEENLHTKSIWIHIIFLCRS